MYVYLTELVWQEMVTSAYLLKKIYFIFRSRMSLDCFYETWQYELLSTQKLFERKIKKTGDV